jgi:phosphinothricin acetyltransferase
MARRFMAETLIRPAAQRDLPALVEIFNHYVIHGHVTFDTALHTVESRQSWFESYGEGRHQLLVALTAERVVGCTYSSRYRPRPAFDATVETSIYLHPDLAVPGHDGPGGSAGGTLQATTYTTAA